jgi:hypothetical protein
MPGRLASVGALFRCRLLPMISDRERESDFRVEVVDDEIIVTLPGSHYSVTYYKSAKSPQLIAKFISDRDDPRVAMGLSEFLTRAWRLANDKTRELGWGWVV